TADLTVLAQTTNQCTAQLAARNDVNRRIDGLVGDSLCHVLRVIAPQSRRNLLWRPTVLEPPANIAMQPRIGEQFAWPTGNARSPLRTPLRGRRPVVRRSALRRNSRLTVEALRPSCQAIKRTPHPNATALLISSR